METYSIIAHKPFLDDFQRTVPELVPHKGSPVEGVGSEGKGGQLVAETPLAWRTLLLQFANDGHVEEHVSDALCGHAAPEVAEEPGVVSTLIVLEVHRH